MSYELLKRRNPNSQFASLNESKRTRLTTRAFGFIEGAKIFVVDTKGLDAPFLHAENATSCSDAENVQKYHQNINSALQRFSWSMMGPTICFPNLCQASDAKKLSEADPL
eukprot:GHVL01007615.1.p1 GENE.GHVL01007615.1~~GHVL01007615.1.p1  ORF type:complete len:110 (+),score=6.14 GHVL01007615.1:215-544(+)